MFRSKKRETQMDDLISSVRSKSVCNFTETRTDSCAPHCIQCESHEKRSGDRHACAIQWPSYGNHNENEKQHVDLSLIHISEPTRLLSISYAVFCLKKKKKK